MRDAGPGIHSRRDPVVLSAFGRGSIAIKSAEAGHRPRRLPIVQGLLALRGGEFELRSSCAGAPRRSPSSATARDGSAARRADAEKRRGEARLGPPPAAAMPGQRRRRSPDDAGRECAPHPRRALGRDRAALAAGRVVRRRARVAPIGRLRGKQAVGRNGGVDGVEHRGRRSDAAETVEDDRHLLGACRDDSAGNRGELAPADAAQALRSGSPRWALYSARRLAASTTPRPCGRSSPHQRPSLSPDPGSCAVAAVEARRRWRPPPSNCRRRDRRGTEDRCRRRPPPCRRPLWRRSCLVERRFPGDVAGRQVERQVEDLQSEIVRKANQVDRGTPAAQSSTERRRRLDRMRRDALPGHAVDCRRRSRPCSGRSQAGRSPDQFGEPGGEILRAVPRRTGPVSLP